MSDFDIHQLHAGGGTLALMPLPGRDGAYVADLAKVRAWRPDLVISMTTAVEMERHGAGALGADLAARDIEWVHLPVEDFGIPSSEIGLRWPDISIAAQRVLATQGRLLVHCFGGCGRSGMIVLRLMVECGEEAGPALTRLRTVRPCAVETEDQRRWATEATRT